MEKNLVDSHGDFVAAVQCAAEIAGLSVDDSHSVRVVNLYSRRNGYVLPKAYEAAQEMTWILSRDWLSELNGRPLWLLPANFKWQ